MFPFLDKSTSDIKINLMVKKIIDNLLAIKVFIIKRSILIYFLYTIALNGRGEQNRIHFIRRHNDIAYKINLFRFDMQLKTSN